jgi:hypothetical protein
VKVEFHVEAEDELFAAAEYYDQRESGLGRALIAEVGAAVLQIVDHPLAWPKLDREVRRCLIRRFPYSLLFCFDQDRIFIVAFMHLHRRPGYWRSRLA